LIGRNRAEEANELFRHGCMTSPNFAPVWFGFAITCQKLGRWDQALLAYDEALKADPNYVEALVDKGVLLRNMLRHHESLACFERALEIQPEHQTALGNYAILLSEFKQVDKSIEIFDRLHRLYPNHDYIAGLLLYERMHVADWTEYATLREEIIAGVRDGRKVCKSLPFMALSDSAEDQFKCGCIFANAYTAKPQGPLWKGEVYNHEKLRIAYVSPDLREHPVGHLMAGIFEAHDKSRVETIAVSLGIDDRSRLRERILSTFDHVIEARGMASNKIAEQMRAMEIDIAIDLAGYTADSRTDIFSWRPAPVHVNFLGYAGTLGVEYMDYIIADRHVIPPEHQACFMEKVLYMPDSYLPTDRNLQIADETPSRAACGLPSRMTIKSRRRSGVCGCPCLTKCLVPFCGWWRVTSRRKRTSAMQPKCSACPAAVWFLPVACRASRIIWPVTAWRTSSSTPGPIMPIRRRPMRWVPACRSSPIWAEPSQPASLRASCIRSDCRT
jgi:predicted O-linked N-acetylglucosamine transferase (SPINDLY family)